jgi:hypothetical protein
MLCDSETVSKIYRVNGSGEEIPRGYGDAEFWQHRLVLVPDEDGGDDHLVVDYGDAVLEFHDPDGHWEHDVRRRDVEDYERLHPELAEPPPPTDKEPTPKKKRREAKQPSRAGRPEEVGLGGGQTICKT